MCWPGCCWPSSCCGCWPRSPGSTRRAGSRPATPLDRWDEGFANLANARERVLSGQFATGDIDRSLTNGAYSAVAAAMFAVTGPSLAAGRALSMVAVAAGVLLLASGWPGRWAASAALLAAASALGGPTSCSSTAGSPWSRRPWWRCWPRRSCSPPGRPGGRRLPPGLGYAVAAAVSVKAIALLPGLVMLAVVVGRGGRPPGPGSDGHGPGRGGDPGGGRPGWTRPHQLESVPDLARIWLTVEYLDEPAAIAGRLGRYLADSDQALGRSLPLLLAAALGLAALVRRWPRLAPEARDALVMAFLWGVGLWLAVAVADYLPDHYGAPNRYVVLALPGLAVLAGFGLLDLAALVGRGRQRWLAGVAGIALGLAVALPGVLTYLDGAMDSGRSREQGQRALAASLPTSAVVYGVYAPTMLFDTQLVTRTPWPTADANVRDPIGRLGVTHVLVGALPADPTGRADPGRPRAGATLARVRWGSGELVLYGPQATPGAGFSPLATPIDYDPLAGPSRQLQRSRMPADPSCSRSSW